MLSHCSDSRRQFLKTSLLGGLGIAAGLRLAGVARAQNSTPAPAARGAAPATAPAIFWSAATQAPPWRSP